MPHAPIPLPPEFAGRPFTVAEARSFGVSRGRMRAADLRAPFHGVRVPAGNVTLLAACRARLKPLAAEAVISHVTAARLHAVPLPPSLARVSIVHVSVPAGARAPAGKNTAGHQVTLRTTDFDSRHGVACTTPERTFCDLAAMLTLAQLVAVGDNLLRRGTVSRAALTDAVAAYPGRRGTARLRRALELLDARSESPKESELRVLLIEAGFPSPLVNASVCGRSGSVRRTDRPVVSRSQDRDRVRGRPPSRQVSVRADFARRRRLEALGWTYLSVTQADLDSPRDLLADLRAVMSR